MLFFIFHFTEEVLLSFYIIGGLLFCSFVKRQKTFFSDLFYQKKMFFVFCKATFLFLLMILLVNLFSFGYVNGKVQTLFDSLSTLEFYNVSIIDSYGNCFFRKDFLVIFFNLVLNVLTILYLIVFYEYSKNTKTFLKYYLEIPLLIVTIFFGFKIFLLSYDFLLIVIALELTAFCSVILISLQLATSSENIFPFEAAIKYFIFNALSISLLLFAISGYYALFKTLNLLDLTFYFLLTPELCFENLETLLLLNLFFFSAYLIKLGAAPFHQWVPDVYEGAELIITAFLVLIVGPALNLKFFIFVKILLPLFEVNSLIFAFFFLTGLLSIFLGSFNAFNQLRIKRFLAYTGITHLGYILLSFGTATFLGFFASFFYLIFYIITNFSLFTIILLSQRISGTRLVFLNHFKLVLNENFLLFFLFFVPIFSFAGFPPFAGFFSKFFMFLSLIDINNILITLCLIFYILLSAYLYLRFIKISLFEEHKLELYLPIQVNQTKTYYKLNNLYKLNNWHFSYHNLILFILFLTNSILFNFFFFLPTFCLAFQKPLLTLFLFY